MKNSELKLLANAEQQKLYLEAIQGAQAEDAYFTRLCFETGRDKPVDQHLFARKGEQLQRRDQQNYYTLSDDADRYNNYVTINSFQYIDGKIDKSKKCLKAIGTMYFDIDFHDSQDATIQELIDGSADKLQSLINDNLIMEPSMVVISGRGLGIYYCLADVILKEDMKRVQKFFEAYYAMFDHFEKLLGQELDPRVLDSSRIARIAGTKNLKSGTYCRIISYNQDDKDQVVRYSLEKLHGYIEDFIDEKAKEKAMDKIFKLYGIKPKKNVVPKKAVSSKEKMVKNTAKPAKTVEVDLRYINYYLFMKDFIERAVGTLKDRFNCPGTGRQWLLYAYYSFWIIINGEIAKEKANELNDLFALPLSQYTVNNIFSFIDENGPYILSKDHLIEGTCITFQEAEELGLYAPENKAIKLTEKRNMRMKMYEIIVDLSGQGVSIRKIQRKLLNDYGIKYSVGQIHNVINGKVISLANPQEEEMDFMNSVNTFMNGEE